MADTATATPTEQQSVKSITIEADPAVERKETVTTLPDTPPPENEEEERESWGSKISYILTLVGYAVGFGNIWRFPYLLHSNGGVAFLIPYVFMLAFEGIPLFFLELAIGQRLRKGALGCWNEISPYLGGVGVACGLSCYVVAMYYNTLIAWVMSYLFDSFKETLSWRDCELLGENPVHDEFLALDELDQKVPLECQVAKQATKYYWYRRTLDISDSITDPGRFNPYMLLYIFLSWVIIWCILVKGIKVAGKVVYFTALFPYVTLLCFFVGNFWLPGYENGYTILFKPDFTVLLKPQTWLTAGTQIFFSLGIGYGCLIAFASYLPSNNNCYKDAVSVSLINCSTSLLAAIVIFPVLGAQGTRKYESCLQSRKFELLEILGKITFNNTKSPQAMDRFDSDYHLIGSEVAVGPITMYMDHGNKFTLESPFMPSDIMCDLDREVRNSGSGTGLVFIAFAEAAINLPCPQFWCFLFFFMLFTLGVDSGFGTVEGAIAALIDSKLLKWPRWAITSLICGTSMLCAFVFAWGWGVYVQVLLDTFVANWTLLIISFFEVVGIAWVYGLAQFSYDIKLMTGSKPNVYMLICWKYVSPFILIVILIASIVDQFWEGYYYDRYDINIGGTVSTPYPGKIVALGYSLWLSVVLWIPLQAILKYYGKSILKEEKPMFFPEEELRAERNMTATDDDTEQFGKMDMLVMGKSVEDFVAYRERTKSTTSINQPTEDLATTPSEPITNA